MAARKRSVAVDESEDTTVNLLRQLSTMDECEAYSIVDGDHHNGAPGWAELALEIVREGKGLLHYFRRHDAELVVEVLFKVLHPNAGKSINGEIWRELDETMVVLMEGADDAEKIRSQGKALGLATALARISNPYAPNVDEIRKLARERYDASRQ